MKKVLFLGVVLAIQAVFFTLHAFAYRGDVTIASIRQEHRANQVKISGTLICDMGSENTGQTCELRIKDNKTGQIFLLTATQAVMGLYSTGKKRVQIEGMLTGSNTIEVSRANAI